MATLTRNAEEAVTVIATLCKERGTPCSLTFGEVATKLGWTNAAHVSILWNRVALSMHLALLEGHDLLVRVGPIGNNRRGFNAVQMRSEAVGPEIARLQSGSSESGPFSGSIKSRGGR